MTKPGDNEQPAPVQVKNLLQDGEKTIAWRRSAIVQVSSRKASPLSALLNLSKAPRGRSRSA